MAYGIPPSVVQHENGRPSRQTVKYQNDSLLRKVVFVEFYMGKNGRPYFNFY